MSGKRPASSYPKVKFHHIAIPAVGLRFEVSYVPDGHLNSGEKDVADEAVSGA